MSRQMYDACNPENIPADAAMVAGYLFGGCQWSPAAWDRFPDAVKVRICTVAGNNAGEVLDVERGDATPSDAVNWVARARGRGQIPTVYVSQSNVDQVLADCTLHEVAAPQIWVAQWDGVSDVPAGTVAKQYASEVAKGYDLSDVADYWPGVDAPPDPPPIGPEDVTMFLYQAPDGTIYLCGVGTKTPFVNIADVKMYMGQGVKLYQSSQFSADWQTKIAAWPTVQ
jgi:hypothetical protein